MKHISEIIDKIKSQNPYWVEYNKQQEKEQTEIINTQLKLNL